MASAFNGLFFSVFQFAGFVGTATSSLVLLVDKSGASRMLLSLILGAISLTGSLSTLALPKIPPGAAGAGADDAGAGQCSQTLALVVKEPRVSLLVPLIFTNGCFMGFIFGDYPKAFVSAAIGPNCAGVALMVFYGFNSVASVVWGWLILRGHLKVWSALAAAFAVQMVMLLSLFSASVGLVG